MWTKELESPTFNDDSRDFFFLLHQATWNWFYRILRSGDSELPSQGEISCQRQNGTRVNGVFNYLFGHPIVFSRYHRMAVFAVMDFLSKMNVEIEWRKILLIFIRSAGIAMQPSLGQQFRMCLWKSTGTRNLNTEVCVTVLENWDLNSLWITCGGWDSAFAGRRQRGR